MKSLLYTLTLLYLSVSVHGQEMDSLQSLHLSKSKQLDSLNFQLETLIGQTDSLTKEVTNLKDQITPFPRWKFGVFGTGGFNISTYSNWLSKEASNTTAINIGVTINGFVEIQQRKYFWKNAFNNNTGWLKFDDKEGAEEEVGFEVAADAFNVSSLFGWKIVPKLALSVLAEYRTSLLDGTFNNPGYLDVGGGGFTWTPNANFRAVVHSLNFNWVFAKEDFTYESSLGAKVILDYNRQFSENFSWTSNLSIFASYKDLNQLSNWTWINHFSTAVKGIGVGLDVGLRGNKQEAYAKELNNNPIQTYWVLGLTYGLSKIW